MHESGQNKGEEAIFLDPLEPNAGYRKNFGMKFESSSRLRQCRERKQIVIECAVSLVVVGAFVAFGVMLSRLETEYKRLNNDTEKLMAARTGNKTYEDVEIERDFSATFNNLGMKTNETGPSQQLYGLTRKEKDRLNLRLNTLERRINESRKFEISLSVRQEEEAECIEEYGGILYNGSCLWAEPISKPVNLLDALATCNNRTKSKLPEVYGGNEYLQIMNYLRRKKVPKFGLAWTAMTRNHINGHAMMSDGSIAPYQKIRTKENQWTDAEMRRSNVYLSAGDDPTNTDQGMGSIWPEYEVSVLLCQKI